MQDSKFEKMTTEELKKRVKLTKVVTTALGTMLLLLFVMGIFTFDKTKSLFAVPFGLLPIVIINIGNIRQLNKELETRKAE
jgi:L-asparagine transporter-like permease